MNATHIHRPSVTQRKILSFALGDQEYALPLSAVQEIVPMALLVRAPGLPSIVEGFLNFGGTTTAVIHLGRLFGQAVAPSRFYTPLLILRNRDLPLALIVDRVVGLSAISTDSIVRLGEGASLNDCAEGVFIQEKRALVMLSPERIMLDQERTCLAELLAAEQARIAALEETAS